MNLEEAIKQIKEIRDESEFFSEQPNTRNYYLAKIYAIDTVLAEIDRLKVKNEQLNYLVNQWFIGEPKEITLREGLELTQKECFKCEYGTNEKCPFYLECDFDKGINLAHSWDIDSIIQAVDKLKEENNENT